MNYRLSLLFLLLGLFALSADTAWACGSGTNAGCGSAAEEQSCCSGKCEETTRCCTDDSSDCEQEHPGKKCPDQKGCGHCPCGSATGSAASALLEDSSPGFTSILVCTDTHLGQAFYYAQHMPEAVYLPIWQPPKLGV